MNRSDGSLDLAELAAHDGARLLLKASRDLGGEVAHHGHKGRARLIVECARLCDGGDAVGCVRVKISRDPFANPFDDLRGQRIEHAVSQGHEERDLVGKAQSGETWLSQHSPDALAAGDLRLDASVRKTAEAGEPLELEELGVVEADMR